MKKSISKYLKIACLGTALLFASSCTNLDEVWYSKSTPEKFFTTRESVYGVLGRPFTHWRWFEGDDRFYLQELTTDEMCLPQRGTNWINDYIYFRLQYHDWSPDHTMVWNTWSGVARGLGQCWEAFEDLSQADYEAIGFSADDKKHHLAYIKTMEAYFYMRGLDFFGGWPLHSSTSENPKARSTDEETFRYIESMLKEYIPQLPVKSSLGGTPDGFPRRAAGAAILARLYFNAEAYIGTPMYSEAAQICQDIIDNKYGTYQLDNTWYGPHTFQNQLSDENIWQIVSETGKLQYDWYFIRFYHYTSSVYFNSETRGYNGIQLAPSKNPKGELYTFQLGKPFAKFHDNDLRKKPYRYFQGTKTYEGMFLYGLQKNMDTGETAKGTQEYNGQDLVLVDQVARFKTVGSGVTVDKLTSTMADGEENSGVRLVKIPQVNMAHISNRWDPDAPVFRLAEIYYTLAECKMRDGKKDEAAKLINEVRKRNFPNRIDPDPVTETNLDEYRMLDEWMLEFLGEAGGRRRTDLIRWGKYVTESWWDHAPTNDPNRNRFPIPTLAISANNLLKQNPGY